MEDSRTFENDPVERFLGTHFPGTVNVEVRQTLLMQTTRVLQRRRRLKRIGHVTALVGCYLLGLATMQVWLVRSPTTTGTVMVLPDNQTPAEGKAAMDTMPTPDHAQAAPTLDREPEIPAFVLERMAQSSQESRSLLYRRAGDRYLADGDLKSAVHCYSRSLDAGSQKDWTVSKEDNWLLIHLKTARQEEKRYAESAG